MIIRLFHAKVRQGKEAEFRKTFENLTVPGIQARKGMVAIYPGQPFGAGSNDFVLITIWKDQAAAQNHTQADWAKAIFPEEALPLLEECRVHNYKSCSRCGILEEAGRPAFQNI